MSAKDDTIPVRLNEPKSWIDESACVVNGGIGVVREGGGRVGIHTIRDDSRSGIYQKNRLQVSSNGAVKTSRKRGDFGGMSGGLTRTGARGPPFFSACWTCCCRV